QALPAAAAIELLHNFSLIHDDIEDASPTRRGRDTVWKIWGIEQGINAGDSMFAVAHLAMNYLLERDVNAAVVVQALRRFDETCVALTQGQHLDMDFEKRDKVSVAEYLQMITGKTAVLISLSAELGALIAGADPEIVNHYAQFGRNLGLAFQVIDDILGIWGDETLTGKSAATDIMTKKKTLPVLYGLAQNAELRQLYAREDVNDAFVETAVRLLDQSGAHPYAADQAAAYSQNALGSLEATEAVGPAAKALEQLANKLLKRNY
ncbi:MAG: polyprenyl synthetase family protein, partial [Chloroflexi bacterium]|nr:polyprenyl synthetase family protein [Chloroflexota bacterium]